MSVDGRKFLPDLGLAIRITRSIFMMITSGKVIYHVLDLSEKSRFSSVQKQFHLNDIHSHFLL